MLDADKTRQIRGFLTIFRLRFVAIHVIIITWIATKHLVDDPKKLEG